MKLIEFFLNHPSVENNQRRAAGMLGVRQSDVSYWINRGKTERADIPSYLIPKAAEALGMKIGDFATQAFCPETFEKKRPNLSRIFKFKRTLADRVNE